MSKIRLAAIGVPPTPPAGKVYLYIDPADTHLKQKDENGTVIDLTAGGGGGGEANTASNKGSAGVGPFDNKNGVDLELRNIHSPTGKITVSLDAPNKNIDLGVNLAPSDVSLGNVTNDAQLKRADNDWSGFTEEASPLSADLLLLEKGVGGAKRKVQVGNLPTGGGGGINEEEFAIREHFPANNLDLDELGEYGWRRANTGTASDVRYGSIAGHPGVIRLDGGSNSNGFASISLGQTASKSFLIGGQNKIVFEAVICFLNSIAPVDLDYIQAGIGDNDWGSGGLLNDAVVVRFNPSVSNKFQLMTSSGGVNSVVSAILHADVALATWYRVGFEISDPGGTPSVQLYVNGVAEGAPIITNIPTIDMIAGVKIDAAGGSSPEMDIDRYLLKQIADGED